MISETVDRSLPDLPDTQLIESCLQGSTQAWDTLIRRYQRLIYSIPLRYHLSAEDAADIFQTVCVVWMEKLQTLRDNSMLSSWLYTTTQRECWKHLETRRREVDLDELQDALEVIDNKAEQMILQHQVRMGLEKLPENCKKLLFSLYYADPPLSQEEVSAQFGIPLGSIGPNRGRCLERLRKLLGEKK